MTPGTRILGTSLSRQGVSIREIARQTGLSRNTIRKLLRGEHDLKFHTPERSSRLDPFKEYLRERIALYPLSAVRLIEEIRPMGYTGSIVTLRRFLATIRNDRVRKEKATVRFETPPGKQAQVDWAYIGRFPDADGKLIAVYAFIMVLSFSRRIFVRFATSMKIKQLIESHQRAFEHFGGWTSTLLYDNMKQIRVGPGRLNEQLLDFANHHGFTIKTHRAYRPRTKGKIERAVDYIKDNFLTGRTFIGLDDLNAQALHWMQAVADVRIHGTTHQQPIALFEQEKEHLVPISQAAVYQIRQPVDRVVSTESLVRFEASQYSVPPEHVGKTVQVLAEGGAIFVRLGDIIIAEHAQADRPGQTMTQREHLAELWKLASMQTPVPQDARCHIDFTQKVQETPLSLYQEVSA
ncbi:IS21 family transposase [bacterium]|nr:IS21 family transposase [bacterium]